MNDSMKVISVLLYLFAAVIFASHGLKGAETISVNWAFAAASLASALYVITSAFK